MPFTATSTWRAPLRTAARLFATAKPRSLWQCTLMTTSSMPGTFSRIFAIRPPNSSGIVYPTVSGMLSVVAPASTAAVSTS